MPQSKKVLNATRAVQFPILIMMALMMKMINVRRLQELKKIMVVPKLQQETIKKIQYSAQHLFFATGSYKLLPKSYSSLNDVVKILNADTNLKLDRDGHTDSTGNQEKNLVLREQRAKAVTAYLVSKGITEDRFKATGFGSNRPIASNKTATGRNKNRRVDLKLSY